MKRFYYQKTIFRLCLIPVAAALFFINTWAAMVPGGVEFIKNTLHREAQNGDNWCITWGADGHQYTAMCDGSGWGLGQWAHSHVWRLKGEADNFIAESLDGYPAPPMNGYFTYGIGSINGTIYNFLSRVPQDGWSSPFLGVNLIYSPDNGQTWFRWDGIDVTGKTLSTTAGTQFFWHEQPRTVHGKEAYAFATISFAQQGQDHSAATDNYVYIYSPDGPYPHQLNMARVPKDRVTDRSAYEFFKSRNTDSSATWTIDMSARGVVHTFPEKTGNDYFGWYSWLPSVVWNRGLGLYIMVTGGTYAGNCVCETEFYSAWMHSKTGSLGFYYAKRPWGPWQEFFYEPYWTVDSTANRTYQPKFSPKWISEDGTEMVLIWSDAMKNAAGHSHTVNYKWNQMKIKITGSFTEPPASASGPVPADGATKVSIFQNLDWTAGKRTNCHQVYWGTDPTPDNDAGSSEFQRTQFNTGFDPGLLQENTTYYWCIDEVNNVDTTKGPVWHFTTGTMTSDPNLAGHWPLDEGSGSTAEDATGRGNDGTLLGGAVWTNGRIGQALQFDGTDDNVKVSQVTTELQPASLTMTAWIKTGHSAAYGWVAAQGDNYGLVVNRRPPSDDVFFYYYNGSSWPEVSSGDVNITDNQWHHIAAVYQAGGSMKVYQDGAEKGSKTVSEAISYVQGSGFTIGTMQGARHFQGIIDEVRVYKRALSSAEILSLYEQTSIIIEPSIGLRIEQTFRCVPNPFNTTLYIQTENYDNAISIYNIKGMLINILIPTPPVFSWDGTNFNNKKVAAGLYYLRSENKHSTSTQHVIYIE